MNDTSIEVEHLRKCFGDVVAVEDVHLTVRPGTIVGLLGPNGAGKTTTIHCLTTLLRPDGGRAWVAGHDVVREPDAVRESIAVTGQFAAVDPALTGRGNLRLFGRLLGLGRREARARADELLGRFDLEAEADKPVTDYSGGLRRRLDLAVSLVIERPVLILDEPTTGLDPRSRRAVWATVAAERERGTAILLTTQYLEEADELADRVVVIDHGRVIREGTASELKETVGGAVCEVRIEDSAARERARAALGEPTADGEVLTVAADAPPALADIVMTLERAHVTPDDVRLRRPSLDEVFLAVTGHEAEAAEERRDREEVHA